MINAFRLSFTLLVNVNQKCNSAYKRHRRGMVTCTSYVYKLSLLKVKNRFYLYKDAILLTKRFRTDHFT